MFNVSRGFVALGAFALAAFFVGGPVYAGSHGLQKVTIRVSADLPPPPHPTAIAMEHFKERVEAIFPAGSEVRNFYAGALYKDADAMAAMGEGNLEMGWLVSGKTAAVDPWLGIIVQPGVLTTVGAVHELANLETGKMLLQRLRDLHGIEPFGFADLSFALGVGGKERLLTLESVKGKKIRTFAAAVNPVMSAWGANPVVMGFGDVPSALQSGVLDGVVTSIGGWRAIFEQTPYYTIAGVGGVAFDTYWAGASQDWLGGLNDASQAKIRELMAETMQLQNELSYCNDKFAISEYAAKTPSEPGVYLASASEAAPLQGAIGNNVADYLKKGLPDEADAWVDRFLTEGRAASSRMAEGSDPLESLDCSSYRAQLKG
jgi:TRAP-type C4-dicarboxylate transport system substrate-binding protein